MSKANKELGQEINYLHRDFAGQRAIYTADVARLAGQLAAAKTDTLITRHYEASARKNALEAGRLKEKLFELLLFYEAIKCVKEGCGEPDCPWLGSADLLPEHWDHRYEAFMVSKQLAYDEPAEEVEHDEPTSEELAELFPDDEKGAPHAG